MDVQHKATTKKRIAYKSAIKFKLAWEKSKELRKNASKKKTGHSESC